MEIVGSADSIIVYIKNVYYKHDYPDSFTDELVAGSNIKFINYNELTKK